MNGRHTFPFHLRALRHCTLVWVVACGPASPPPVAPELTAPPVPPMPAETRSFRHHRSRAVASQTARHRVRDGLAVLGLPQIVEAKFAYGATDKDLKDEDVEVDVVHDGKTERVGVFRTSQDGQAGPADDGGRVRIVFDGAKARPLGRHHFRFTVVGDGTTAEGTLVVVARDQAAFVSDVDGTLTESEFAEVPALMKNHLPAAHSGAARVFGLLADRGYVPIYLTARPEWLVARTRAFLKENHFPEGVLVTKRDKSGALGHAAAVYKKEELAKIAAAVRIHWAFGNMPTDADAYATLLADPKRCVLYRFTDTAHGCRRIESYDDLVPEISALGPP